MEEELLCLQWNNHKSAFFQSLSKLRSKESYSDATLSCEGQFFPVHRLVLSVCSDYFSEVFERTSCKSPFIILKGIRAIDLEGLLTYMYLGKVNIDRKELPSFISAAECLQVKGLAISDSDPCQSKRKATSTDSSNQVKLKKTKIDLEEPTTASSLGGTDVSESKTEICEESSESISVDSIKIEPEELSEVNASGLSSNSILNGMESHLLKPEINTSKSNFELSGSNFQGINYTEEKESWSQASDTDSLCGIFKENSAELSANETYAPLSRQSFGPFNSLGATCSLCGKFFTMAGNLKRHMRIHTGEKPFACTQCPYKSSDASSLKKHMIRHTSQKR